MPTCPAPFTVINSVEPPAPIKPDNLPVPRLYCHFAIPPVPSTLPSDKVDTFPLTDCSIKSFAPSSETKVFPVTSNVALGEVVFIPTF